MKGKYPKMTIKQPPLYWELNQENMQNELVI